MTMANTTWDQEQYILGFDIVWDIRMKKSKNFWKH